MIVLIISIDQESVRNLVDLLFLNYRQLDIFMVNKQLIKLNVLINGMSIDVDMIGVIIIIVSQR